MQDVQQTVISQYANSPVINALVNAINAAIDPANDINNFYNDQFNIATATEYGLDCIGRIVGVSRVLQVAGTQSFFGFSGPDGGSGDSFNVAPFYGGSGTTNNYALTDDAFRQLIYAKALTNISNGSIPAINNVLMLLFGASGICYCTDGHNMTMTYTFSFVPSPVQLAIVSQSGVLPRPSGVAASVVHP